MQTKTKVLIWTATYLTFVSWSLLCIGAAILYIFGELPERGRPEFIIGIIATALAFFYYFNDSGRRFSSNNLLQSWIAFSIHLVGALLAALAATWLRHEFNVMYFFTGSGFMIVAFALIKFLRK